jgi:hypothetical protein
MKNEFIDEAFKNTSTNIWTTTSMSQRENLREVSQLTFSNQFRILPEFDDFDI